MEIKYSGKFIEQYKEIKDLLNRTFNKDEKEIIYKYINSKKDKKKLFNYEILNNFNQEQIDLILFYEGILHSFNKSKGEWLEKLFRHILDNSNSFNLIENSWKENIIYNFLPSSDIRINNRTFVKSQVLFFKDLGNIKKIGFQTSNINKLHTNIIKFKHLIEEINIVPIFYTYNDVFFYNIKFKKIIDKNILFEILNQSKQFFIIDLAKIRTDFIVKDNKGSVFILEVKNNDTELNFSATDKCLAYGIKEKVFNKSKFKKLYLVHQGFLEGIFINRLKELNLRIKDIYKFEIIPISVSDYLDLLKNNYFDSPNSNKKNSKPFDIDRMDFIVDGNILNSPIPLFENRGDNNIILHRDHLFIKSDKKKTKIQRKENIDKDNEYRKLSESVYKNG